MSTLMLVNPRTRRARKHNPSRKRRSAAQRRATRALVAASKARRMSNPRRRKHSYRAVARKSNPVHSYRKHAHRRKHRRHNPISMPRVGGIVSMLKAGALGAGGALAVDFAMGNLPLPDSIITRTNSDGSTNYLYFGSKIALAVGLGVLGKKFLGNKAASMAEGAMVVNMYDLFRTLMPANIKLGYFTPAPVARNMRAYIPGRSQMGAYIPPGSTATGTNPAMKTHLGGIPSVVTRGRAYAR